MEITISHFFLIIILSNFIILILWYLFSNNFNLTTAKWDEIYNITKYPMDNFIGTDMNQILRDCDILYHQLNSLLKIGIIDNNNSLLVFTLYHPIFLLLLFLKEHMLLFHYTYP